MKPDPWAIYEHMLRSRLFEEAVTRIWQDGRISGEMHLSTGEEAIVAGSVLQLRQGDAVALDHRGTSPLVMLGVPLDLLLNEFLGRPQGLCGGRGGHMHLFSRKHLAASSGIVGASGPAAAGFALAGSRLRPGSVALSFFGEGAINQGMMMEALNLSVVWRLPVLFVCKDSRWAITTVSASVTGGDIVGRAESFGMPAGKADGRDVDSVWETAAAALQRMRKKPGPYFLYAPCVHPEGHFLGDPLLRIQKNPVAEVRKLAGPMLRSAVRRKGASVVGRTGGLGRIGAAIGKTTAQRVFGGKDPVAEARRRLDPDRNRLEALEARVERQVRAAVALTESP